MKPGDRVRFLHNKEQGIVRTISEKNIVDVEIEDGFVIPVLKSELVIIASEETSVFEKSEKDIYQEESLAKHPEDGVFFAFAHFNDKTLNLHLINNQSASIYFTIYEKSEEGYKGIFAGNLKGRSEHKITDYTIANFENWPPLYIQILTFLNKSKSIPEPFHRKLSFKANTFFNSKRKAPLLNKEAFMYRLDEEKIIINPEEIKGQMLNNIPAPTSKSISQPPKEVDLHIENLIENHEKMKGSEILQFQIQTFEKALDDAIATGMDEITFIHGIGNGILKNSIHKLLGSKPGIKFFKDSQKEKFGYGATLVKIK